MHSPADASPTPSRAPAHGSGPMWFGRVGSRRGPGRMMDVSSIPLSFRTAEFFPSTAGRLAYQAAPSPVGCSAKACSRHTLCRTPGLHPRFVHLVACVNGTAPESGLRGSGAHRRPGGISTTPGALARVQVVVSRSVTACQPHPAPLAGRIAISPHGGCRTMPSRRGKAVPGFCCTFLPGMPSSSRPRESDHRRFQASDVSIISPRK